MFDVYLDANYRYGHCNANPEDDDGIVMYQTWFDNSLCLNLDSLKDVLNFEYRKIEFLHNDGEFLYYKIKDGEVVNINSLVNKEFSFTVKDMSG